MIARYSLGNLHFPLMPSVTIHGVSVFSFGSFEDHAAMIIRFNEIILSNILTSGADKVGTWGLLPIETALRRVTSL